MFFLLASTHTTLPITSKRAGIEGRAVDFLACVNAHHLADYI
jgi:hypothetical protein